MAFFVQNLFTRRKPTDIFLVFCSKKWNVPFGIWPYTKLQLLDKQQLYAVSLKSDGQEKSNKILIFYAPIIVF